MCEKELKDRLTTDLKELHLPIEEVDLFIRPFSKTYYGRYFPSVDEDKVKPRLFMYPYSDKRGNMYVYDVILLNTIHEMVHHIQHTSASFTRIKGVMHDPNFWKLHNRYVERAVSLGMIRKEYKSEKVLQSAL